MVRKRTNSTRKINVAAWTDEMAERVTKDWLDGYSAQQCADRLGGGRITRNAVISKIHRLGVSGRTKVRSPKQATRQWRPSKGPGQSSSQLSVINGRRKRMGAAPFETIAEFYADQALRTAELAALEAMPEVDVPASERRGVADLGDGQCRWPIGDPQRPDFHFCNGKATPGLPYCAQHNARAYVPPKPKSYLPDTRTQNNHFVLDTGKILAEFELMAVRR